MNGVTCGDSLRCGGGSAVRHGRRIIIVAHGGVCSAIVGNGECCWRIPQPHVLGCVDCADFHIPVVDGDGGPLSDGSGKTFRFLAITCQRYVAMVRGSGGFRLLQCAVCGAVPGDEWGSITGRERFLAVVAVRADVACLGCAWHR